MTQDTQEQYEADLFHKPLTYAEALIVRSGKSAAIILPILYHEHIPETVVDVGCGPGSFLKEARELGSTVCVGFDAPWTSKDDLVDPEIDLHSIDLDENLQEDAFLTLGAKYDLAICVEVAEHLSQESAPLLVKALCRASDMILFAAAIQYQIGTGHVNCQWPSYWVAMFEANGFQCHDVIRPRVWGNESVEWWYQQDTLLFVRSGSESEQFIPEPCGRIVDMVHPRHMSSLVSHMETFVTTMSERANRKRKQAHEMEGQ